VLVLIFVVTTVRRRHVKIYADCDNVKNQSNLAKGGIAVASPLSSSFVFARWQHETNGLTAICNCMFWLGA